MLELIYTIFAWLTYALFEVFLVEIACNIIYKNHHGKIKSRRGKKLFIPTSKFVFPMIFIALALFLTMNSIQDVIIKLLISLEWRVIILFFAVFWFDVLWATKVISERKWKFRLVRYSLALLVLSLICLILSYVLPYLI